MNEFNSIWNTLTGTTAKGTEVTTTETKGNTGAVVGGVVLFLIVIAILFWVFGKKGKGQSVATA